MCACRCRIWSRIDTPHQVVLYTLNEHDQPLLMVVAGLFSVDVIGVAAILDAQAVTARAIEPFAQEDPMPVAQIHRTEMFKAGAPRTMS